MAETWEETKARLKKQGINLSQPVVIESKPVVQHREPEAEDFDKVKRYNVHKRSLPIGIDTIVLFGITKEEAEWFIEYKLKPKCYENGPDDSKTVIYYDVIPVGATPKERSIYFNANPVTTEPVLGYTPKRIN